MTVSTNLLLLYPLLLLVLLFFRSKHSTGGEFSAAFMSLEQCRMIRGAACICVIIHHLTQQITGYGSLWRGPITIFSEAGYLFTAIFFFLSGYGLIVNVYQREDYLVGFPARRLTAVLIPFWMINAIIVGVKALAGWDSYHFRSAAMYVSGLLLVNSNGWFVVEITILYLLFYLSFRLIRKKNISMIILSAGTLLLIAWSFTRGHDPQGAQVHWFRGEWWYNSTAAFVFGIWYARIREKLDSLWLKSGAKSGKFYVAVLAAATAGFAFLFYAAIRINRIRGYYHSGLAGRNDSLITLLSQTGACLSFLLLLILLSRMITLNSPAMTWIGGISLELFLIHRPVMDLLPDSLLKNPFLWYAAVLAGSLIAAAVVSPLTRMLSKKAGRFLEKRCTRRHVSGGDPSKTGASEGEQAGSEKERAQAVKAQNRDRIAARVRIMRLAARIALPVAALLILYLTAGRSLIRAAEARREYQALQSAQIGDRVLFGRYDTNLFMGKDRLTWIVVSREDGRLCLLCEKGIAGSYYHQKHEAVSWEESDLRKLLNSDDSLKAFSKAERELLVPDGEDLISLLTVREAKALFRTDEERELDVTEVAKAQGTNTNLLSKANNWDMKGYRSSWWWLRGEDGEKEITAPIVTVDGIVSENEKYVNKPGGAVRPVIWVKVD